MSKRSSRLVPAVLILAAMSAAPLVPAADGPEWPGFRGPESNPVSETPFADTWSKTQNVEWVTEIQGLGWSSPIVSGGKVFVTAAINEGESKKPQVGTEYSNEYVAELMKQGLSEKEVEARVVARDFELPGEVTLHYFLYCFDLQTGKLLWKQQYHSGRPPVGRHRKNSFTSETPVTDGTRVYVYATSLGLYAYDMDGRQVWQTPLDPYPVYGDFGTGASPALAGSRLIVVSDNEKQQFIAAFDTTTGKQLWRTDRDLAPRPGSRRTAWSTPYVWTTPGRTEVVTIGPGFAVSYDLDGKELWRLAGMSPSPIPSPYAYGGLLLVNGGKTGSIFAVKPGARGDLTTKPNDALSEYVAWRQDRAGTYLATQVAYDGAFYSLTENGILSRSDAKTGAVTWRARIEGGVSFTSSPWAGNGKVFCLNEEGKTFVIAAADEYRLLRTNDLDEMALATPALVGDRLLLRTENHLYSIRQRQASPEEHISGRRDR